MAGVAIVAVLAVAVEETPVSMLDDGLMSRRLEIEREEGVVVVEGRDRPEICVFVGRYGCRSGEEESTVREGGRER